jgi:hypothetical protein
VQEGKAYGVLPNSADADFDDFSRSSAGSKVDKNGLINTGLGLGSEEVVNGDFDSASNWEVSVATISGGRAIFISATNAYSYVRQAGVLTQNKEYEVTINLTVNSGSGIKFQDGSGTTFSVISESGVHTRRFTATTTNATFVIAREFDSGGYDMYVESVSVREVTEVNTDVPRIDYTGGGCPSLLLEPASTNYIEYSEDFNQSYWQHNADITTTNSSELAPNGRLNANLIEYDGSGYSFIRIYGSVPSTASTLSVFAKKGNWRYFGLRHFQASGNDHTVFDFDTETFSNTASGQIASFEVFPDGWYKIKVTHPSPESNSIVGFAISNSSGAESNTTGGQVANVHLFGAQLENQPYATSYIPNYGTASGVTRSQDVSGYTGDISVDIDSGEGVFFAEIAYFDADQQGFPHMSISDGTADNRISIQKQSNTANAVAFNVRDSNVGQCFLQESTIDKSNYFKIAGKYKQDDFALFINGNKISVDTSGSVPTGLNTFSFDKGNTFSKFFGRVRQVRIYDEVLSDNELEELTTL